MVEPVRQPGAGLVHRIGLHPREVVLIVIDQVGERHGRDHRRVAQRLQFEMPAVRGALEFDHYESTLAIDPEQIDPSLGLSERPELLGDDQDVVGDHANVGPQQALQVGPLQHLLHRERRGGHGDDRVGLHLKQRHPGIFRSRHPTRTSRTGTRNGYLPAGRRRRSRPSVPVKRMPRLTIASTNRR